MKIEKVNDVRADITEDGHKIGQVQKAGDGYWVEVFYVEKFFSGWNTEEIEAWVELVQGLHNARVILSVKRLEKYKDWKIQS